MSALQAYQATMDRMIQAIEGYEMPDEATDDEDEFEIVRMVRKAKEGE